MAQLEQIIGSGEQPVELLTRIVSRLGAPAPGTVSARSSSAHCDVLLLMNVTYRFKYEPD